MHRTPPYGLPRNTRHNSTILSHTITIHTHSRLLTYALHSNYSLTHLTQLHPPHSPHLLAPPPRPPPLSPPPQNGHFWPPTPSHPGGTALGLQTGDAPGWQLPSFGNGSSASQGTVANFSAACWFMGTTLSDYYTSGASDRHAQGNAQGDDAKDDDAHGDAHAAGQGVTPIGLISTNAGGTSIHRWVSQRAAAQCSQVTPTSTHSMGSDIGTLFNPMVLPLARMAVSGFTWYQGEANECPKVCVTTPCSVPMIGPCGGTYYACQLKALILDWRLTFVNSDPQVRATSTLKRHWYQVGHSLYGSF